MTEHASFPSGERLLEFRLGPALVVLTESELRTLLGADPSLLAAGLQRGKALRRFRAFRRRVGLPAGPRRG